MNKHGGEPSKGTAYASSITVQQLILPSPPKIHRSVYMYPSSIHQCMYAHIHTHLQTRMRTYIHHKTYCAAIQDFRLNRVEIEESQEADGTGRVKPKKKKSYDLNTSDKFWQTQKGR